MGGDIDDGRIGKEKKKFSKAVIISFSGQKNKYEWKTIN